MRLLIDGARVWDGTGAPPFPGKVLIEGERIAAVAPHAERVEADGAERIDATGKFLMPGMVEGHAHLSFVDTPRGTALGELPPEDHALMTMDAARRLLGAGFTSACSAAAAKIRLDVAVRDAIVAGLTDGPRLLAASRDGRTRRRPAPASAPGELRRARRRSARGTTHGPALPAR